MKRDLPIITHKQVDELRAAGRAVHVYPRLQQVSVDGFKRYRLYSRCPACGVVVGSTTTVVIDATPASCSPLDAGPL